VIEMGYDGRVAVVTGAGRGLGREHALLLASRGAQVVVNDSGGGVDGEGADAGVATAVVAAIEAAGGTALAATASVETEAGAATIVEQAIQVFGRVDILVNNAGILRDKTFGKMTGEMFDGILAVHLRGAFNMAKAVWPHMQQQHHGRIVNVSSASGLFGNFGQANYAAAKMGLIGFTKVLAIEGARYGIKANAIAPSALTRMTETLIEGELRERLRPALVSPVVGWLAHDDCSVTGETFSCGGGRVARVVVGVGSGWCSPALSVEDVRDHLDVILGLADFAVPSSASEETGVLLSALRRGDLAPN
jgi:NAD(P)-dependent dehydrogenase (short-subunit alcohol dehydrogenase family)